jgi:hypothetical protein
VVGPDVPPQRQRHIEQPLAQLGSLPGRIAHASGLGREDGVEPIRQPVVIIVESYGSEASVPLAPTHFLRGIALF